MDFTDIEILLYDNTGEGDSYKGYLQFISDQGPSRTTGLGGLGEFGYLPRLKGGRDSW